MPIPSTGEARARARNVTVTADVLVEQVIEPMYASFSEPGIRAMLRLLLADGVRMPAYVARWRAAAVDPYHAEIEPLVRRGVRQGSLRQSVLAQAPWLLVATSLFMNLPQPLPGTFLPFRCLFISRSCWWDTLQLPHGACSGTYFGG